MKKTFLAFLFLTLSFGFDFTYTKAFMDFNKGVRYLKTNPQKAQQYFQKAYILLENIDNKSAQVYVMLGRMYLNGWGIGKNYVLAEEYLKKAVSLGNKRAYCPLAKLYIQLNKTDLAQKYLKKAKSLNTCNDVDLK